MIRVEGLLPRSSSSSSRVVCWSLWCSRIESWSLNLGKERRMYDELDGMGWDGLGRDGMYG